MQKYLPELVLSYLHKGVNGLVSETPKPDNPVFQNVYNCVIGSNRIALEGAKDRALELGFETHIVTDNLQGDITEVADFILKTIENHHSTGNKAGCLLFGGEPTVKVLGNGLGGRNQHLALYLSSKIDRANNITILCAGTDGTDGPTNAAGAVIDKGTIADATNKNIDPEFFIQNSDSYHFFQQIGGHIIIGNTGTNVMDIIVVLIKYANQ